MSLFVRISAVLAVAVLGWLAPAEAPIPALSVSPPNPAAGRAVQFFDRSTGSPSSWLWMFGDGESSTSPSPEHIYAAPGTYLVSLWSTNGIGTSFIQEAVQVSPETTLRLIPYHPMEVTVEAVDPRTGVPSPGRAMPQDGRFGQFSFPEITGDPENPEAFVKILDASATGKNTLWVFYGSLTSLEYTMTVREVSTGRVRNFFKAAGTSCGGFDVDSFDFAPPTATPAPAVTTPTRTPTAAAGPPTSTAVPADTATPTVTPTITPTPTRTPAGVVITLRAVSWQWDWYGPPSTPISATSPWPGLNTITLKKGTTYELHIYNGGPVPPPGVNPHLFSGIPALGLPAVQLVSLDDGGSEVVYVFTPQATGSYFFNCADTLCSDGNIANQHDHMNAWINVVP